MPVTDWVPYSYLDKAKNIGEALRHEDFDKVLVLAHVNPDGDALGSLKMAYLLLKALNKECAIYLTPEFPEFFNFLPFPKVYTSLNDLPFSPQAALILDCGEFKRVGEEAKEFVKDLIRVNVDHHEGAGIGQKAAFIEPNAASTTVLLAYVAYALNIELAGELGSACALGILTDTGGFSHSNTSAQVFELSAHLASLGVVFADLREELDHGLRVERMLLWGHLTQKVRFFNEGRIAYCPVTLKDLQAFKAKRDDLEGLVEYLRKLKGVKLSAILREDEEGLCKFSLRSAKDVDVWLLATKLNGGGHRNASGGTLHEPFLKAEEQLLKVLTTS